MTEETLFRVALAKPPSERADFLFAASAREPKLRAAQFVELYNALKKSDEVQRWHAERAKFP